MSINYIQLTPSVKIPKGNFAPLYDFTENRDLFDSCLHAEILSADDPEHSFAELRKAMELMAVDLEVSYCMGAHETGAGPAVKALLASSGPDPLSRQALAAAVRSDMQNFELKPRITAKSLIGNALTRHYHQENSAFRRKENELKHAYFQFLQQRDDPMYAEKYAQYTQDQPNGDPPKHFTTRSFVYDLYDIFSSVGSHAKLQAGDESMENAAAGEECQRILSLFYDLLRILYSLPGHYSMARCPIGEFIPVERNRYNDLHLTFHRTNDIYVKETGSGIEYFLLKEVPAASSDLRAKRELTALARLWQDSIDSPNNVLYMQGTVGHGTLMRRVFGFPDRPFALDDWFIGTLTAPQKDELAAGLIKAVDSLHAMEPPLPHRGLSPSAFYICTVHGRVKPLLASFDTVKDLRADVSFSVGAFLKDYTDDPRTRDFIAPDLLGEDPDLLGADIYSLGRLLSYLYTGRAILGGDADEGPNTASGQGMSGDKRELVCRMTDTDPEKRPDIKEVLRDFTVLAEKENLTPAYAVFSSRGRRVNNEDAFYCSDLDTLAGESVQQSGRAKLPALFGVFDGLGGAEAGDEMSHLAARSIRRSARSLLIRQYRDYTAPMTELAEKADMAVRTYKEENGLEDSGTTMAACLIADNTLAAVNVGDSRIYLLHGGELKQLSKDHCYAPIGGRKGSLYQILGMQDDAYTLEPFTAIAGYVPGDTVLLCTDGISDVLSDAEIAQILSAGTSLGKKAASLAEAAEAKGSGDNMTVILFSEVPSDEI